MPSNNWKGGRIKRGRYIHLHKPNHPDSGKQGYIAEHRLVAEKKLGRRLHPKEAVHHIDGNGANNHPDNLIVFKTHGEHTKIGHPDLFERLKKDFKGKHHSPRTEWKSGHKAWNKGMTGEKSHVFGKQLVERIKCICNGCHKIFEVMPGRFRDGRGKICSSKCWNKNRKLLRKVPNRVNVYALGTNNGKMKV